MNSRSTESKSSRGGTGIALLAGLVAAVVMTTVMLILRHFLGVATPLGLIGDRISVLIPPGPFLALMGKIGGYTPMKELGVSSVIVGQLVVGAIGGWIYSVIARKGQRLPGTLGLFVLLPTILFAVALWPVLGSHYRGLPILSATMVTLAGLIVTFVCYERTLVLGYNWMAKPASGPRDFEYSPHIGRRAIVLGGIGAVVGLGGAGLLRKLYQAATFSYDGTQYKGPELQAITPNDKFYCVTKNVVDPKVNPSLWRLEIGGMVEQKRTYTIEEIKALPAVTQETTLMCISNQLGSGLMSNAVWKGVSLRTLLEASKADPQGKKVLLHGVDNYADTFPLEKALEPTTLVAYEMNGEPLPDRHGAPARVVVPGYFGEKNLKWVTRIEVAGEEAEGFYEKQGWGPDFTIPTRSRIDQPGEWDNVGLGQNPNGVPIKGIAFAGDRGVSKVEVSTDAGKNWEEAKIDYPGTKLTWVLWSYDWKPAGPGEHKLTVRATDGTGAPQPPEKVRSQFSGTTGFHQVTVYLYV